MINNAWWLLLPLMLALSQRPARADEPPRLRILSPEDDAQVADPIVAIRFAVRGGPLSSVTWLVNNRPVSLMRELMAGNPVAHTAEPGEEVRSVRLPVPDLGMVSIKVTGTIAGQEVSTKVHVVRLGLRRREARLLLVSVGVSRYPQPEMTLTFPDKDARDIAQVFRSPRYPTFSGVEARVLLNEQATQARIHDALRWLGQSTAPGDVAILFLAGHGIGDAGKDYFFVPVDGTPSDPSRLLSGDEINRALAETAGRVLVLLDTCHAGAAFARTGKRSDARVGRLLQSNGQIVAIAATTGSEVAQERAQWQNGALTRAVIEGVTGKADHNGDGALYEIELEQYITRRVKQLTENNQTPAIYRPSAVDLLLAHVPKPVYRRPWFWSALGALGAGVVVGAALLARFPPDPSNTINLPQESGFTR